MIKIGIDVGSTTAKLVAVNENDNLLFSKYERHNAKAKETILSFLKELLSEIGDKDISVRITGSIGMGISEKCSLPFVQEVVAAAKAIQKDYSHVTSMIDIGGEDAKVVFFKDAEATDLRMNGNCAGGTGAFIDQMAIILGVNIDELNQLAMNATQVYPIASRCGVFCKTDIQNLIAKNVSRENIAASIFRAVAVQTVVTLAHGCDITTPVLFCGGPLTFIPALRKAFIDYLSLDEKEIILPANGTLLPALGAALFHLDKEDYCKLSHLIDKIDTTLNGNGNLASTGLEPVFASNEEYEAWKERISRHKMISSGLKAGTQDVFIGIDSGSTTTKIVVLDEDSRLLYSYYNINGGNPIKAVEEGLNQLNDECLKQNAVLNIKGSCSTGYGEDLIRSAFQLHSGIIETIAHYMAAHYLNKDVSFILDIGGQDIKAISIDENGAVKNFLMNDKCAAGTGRFLEMMARTLGLSLEEMSVKGLDWKENIVISSMCTVFAESEVVSLVAQNKDVADIIHGLNVSVASKVGALAARLGQNNPGEYMMTGGVAKNPGIVHALEEKLGAKLYICEESQLCGALGAAIFAFEKCKGE